MWKRYTNEVLCSHLLEDCFLCFICVIVVLFWVGGRSFASAWTAWLKPASESRAQSKYISAKQIPSYRVVNISGYPIWQIFSAGSRKLTKITFHCKVSLQHSTLAMGLWAHSCKLRKLYKCDKTDKFSNISVSLISMIVGWDGSVSARQAAMLTEAQLASLPEKSGLSLVQFTSLTLIGWGPAVSSWHAGQLQPYKQH